jgi:hypothetical protein
LALADARVLEAVFGGFPCLGTVEHENADAAHRAKVIEASGQDLRVDGSLIVNCIKAWGTERNDFASDGRGGQRRSSTAENHDAQIGPTAEGEIDREHGHISEGTAGPGRCGAKNLGRRDEFALI